MDKDKIEAYWNNEAIVILKQIRYSHMDIAHNDWEDICQNAFLSFWENVSNGNYPPATWNSLLRMITNCRIADLFREKKRHPKINFDPEMLEMFESMDLIDPATKNDSSTNSSHENNDHKFIPLIRSILISKHRPLQDIMLVYTAKSTEKLREKVKEKFPFVVSRSLEKGINFEVRQINEEPFMEAEENEINDFYDLLTKTCKSLGMEDEIGIKAVKILLISQNPIFDWYLESRKAKVKDYLTFNNKGELIRKKTIKRPYKNFFRDYFYLSERLATLKNFLKNEANNSKNPVSNDRINSWYQIGTLDQTILKKQKYGRVNRIGYKAKAKNYNKIIENLILELG